MKKLTVIDLFSGAGGLSRGFYDAGYDIIMGIDSDSSALKTFEKNHGNAKAMNLDLFNHENIYVLEKYMKKERKQLDVLVGGPPCQGFSLAGKRDETDERNILYSAMVKAAEILRPRAIVLENVTGMLTLYKGQAKEKIFKDFNKLGYKMNVKILYAPDYGVPQIRKRAFFVGILDSDVQFEYPNPTVKAENYVTCEQAIGDLPSLINENNFSLDVVREYESDPITEYQKKMRKGSKKIYNHIATNHTEKTIGYLLMIPDGGKYTDLPEELAKNFKYRESLHRYTSDKPSLTIDTGHRTHFHYRYNRIPTVRENARLQSFPDNFIFFGNKQDQYKQVGNAVPPLLGKAIAEKLKEYLK